MPIRLVYLLLRELSFRVLRRIIIDVIIVFLLDELPVDLGEAVLLEELLPVALHVGVDGVKAKQA